MIPFNMNAKYMKAFILFAMRNPANTYENIKVNVDIISSLLKY